MQFHYLLHAVIRHGEGLLAHGGVDHALLHQVQRSFVHVHRHQFTVLRIRPLQCFRNVLAGRGLETDESIDLVLARLAKHRLRVVEGVAGVALDVDHLNDIDSRAAGEGVFVALQALVQVGLAGHGEEHDVPLAVQFLHYTLSPEAPRRQVVGADEVEPMTVGRVGVDGQHRDIGGDSLVDLGLHEGRVRDGDENARRLAGDHRLKLLHLALWIEGVGAAHLGLHTVLIGSLHQTGICGLPIRQFDIGGDQVVLVGITVFGATAGGQQAGRAQYRQRRRA